MKRMHIRINELLAERGISKNKICKDLDLPRGNFNKYCRDDFKWVDTRFCIRLCDYFGCELSDLLVIIEIEENENDSE